VPLNGVVVAAGTRADAAFATGAIDGDLEDHHLAELAQASTCSATRLRRPHFA
jgi:hypothetical protein